jgi:hypothetical protein
MYENKIAQARADLARITAVMVLSEASGSAQDRARYADSYRLFSRGEPWAICAKSGRMQNCSARRQRDFGHQTGRNRRLGGEVDACDGGCSRADVYQPSLRTQGAPAFVSGMRRRSAVALACRFPPPRTELTAGHRKTCEFSPVPRTFGAFPSMRLSW